MQPLRLTFIAVAFVILVGQMCATQDMQSKALAESMLAQTGLHLPNGIADIFGFIQAQGSDKSCDYFELRWVSRPGTDLLPSKEADELRVPQTFAVRTRRSVTCNTNWLRTDLQFAKLIVFGTTESGEIRGLQVMPQMADPRLVIVECPEYFGEKSTPATRCGEFMKPEATLFVRMRHDPAITQLQFFVAKLTGASAWRLERLGYLPLSGRP